MANIDIANFKYGLDSRRSDLTSIPGTLLTLNNCHINQGGQIDKRFSFVRTLMPANTFGLQATDAGLATFGSVASGTIALPGGLNLIYQQLQHPAVSVFGAIYSAGVHAMTGIVWSTSYMGKALVCASYADGYVFLFYNGTAIIQSYAGRMLSGFGTQDLLRQYTQKDIQYAINALTNGFQASADNPGTLYLDDTNISDNITVYGTSITSPAAVTFSIAESYQLANHVPQQTDYGQAFLAAVAAYAGNITGYPATPGYSGIITVPGGNGVFDLRAPWNLTSKIGVSITGGALTITGGPTANANAATLTSAINALTAATGFSAVNPGAPSASIIVYCPQLSSTFAAVQTTPSYTWPALTDHGTIFSLASSWNFTAALYAYPACGQKTSVAFGGTMYTNYNWWTMQFTTTAGNFTIGAGNLTKGVVNPITLSYPYGIIFNNRAYLANTNNFNFSAVGDPTGWETQNIGAGYLPYTGYYGAVDTVKGFANYQGRLAVFGRRSIQIWITDANPANFVLQQALGNIGCLAPFSIQSIGELDVFFLSDTGVRSIRVRDSSLNAYVNDLGSPIDTLIQAQILGNGYVQNTSSITEPTQNKYWCCIPNASGVGATIYVLSYYPTNKIIAWSTYDASAPGFTITLQAGDTGSVTVSFGGVVIGPVAWHTNLNTTAADLATAINVQTGTTGFVAAAVGAVVTVTMTSFTNVSLAAPVVSYTGTLNGSTVNMIPFIPQKFEIYNGQVYARDANSLYQYGGPTNQVYDNVTATVQTGFLAGGGKQERPAAWKVAKGINYVIQGTWDMYAGMDWLAYNNIGIGALQKISNDNNSSFDQGTVPFSSGGTHFSLMAMSTGAEPASLNSIMFLYELGQET